MRFTWNVIASGGDFFVNPARCDIPDAGDPVESPLIVTGRTGNAPSALQVSMDIVHTYRGDLVIDLVGAGGTAFPVKDVSDDTATTCTPRTPSTRPPTRPTAPGSSASRTRLTVDTGYIDSWKLTF